MVSRRVSVEVDADLNGYNRGVMSGVASTKAWIRELESADSRLSGILQTGMALAPALTPLSAAAVGPIAGLTTQLGFLAVAGGTTMLAFQGIGDAAKALNDFELERTPENLQKLRKAMDALGPDGEIFVRRLQDARKSLQDLQDVAQAGMLPGATEGLDSLLTQMPRLERVIASVSSAVGDLMADTGEGLAGDEWSEFFDYLEREAGPIIEDTGHTLGNLVEGITNMVMASDELSDDFVAGLLSSSEAFVDWSDNLDSNQGFQKLVNYVQQSGPQALATLGALAGMFLEFAEAAAPVGDVVLPVLEVLADVLGELADSPVGPMLIASAAGIGVLGRSLAVLNAVGLRGNDSVVGRIFATDKITAGVSAMKLGQQSLYNITTAAERAEMSETQLAAAKERQVKAEEKRTRAMKDGAVQMGKAAAAGVGLAIATSGVADGIGLTNSTSLALMGTLGGPWGVGIGAAAGLMMDFAESGNLAEDMQTQLSAAVRSAGTDFTALNAAVEAGSASLDEYFERQTFLGKAWEGADYLLTGASAYDQVVAKQQEAEDQARHSMQAFSAIARSMGEDFTDSIGRSVAPTLDQLTRTAEVALPAMQALGISVEDLADMTPEQLGRAADDIARWTRNADSAEGRTQAVAESFRALDDQMVQTATAAEMVEAALDSLLGPGLDLSAANDAWITSLRTLDDELAKHNRTLEGNSDAAIKNRSAVRDRVGAMRDVLVAEANAGASSKELAERLRNQRKALLDAGDAAGISRKQMNNYLDELGLTPKLVKTIIKAETGEAMANINGFKFRWDSIKDKTVYLRTVETRTGPGGQGNGYDPSARGNIFPSVRAFAYGDIANGHQPEMAGPGVARVWREEETEGETYIPHADDHRRPRAKRILEDTAGMFGGEVLWFAGGGTTGKKKPPKKGAKRGEDQPELRMNDAALQMQLDAMEAAYAAAMQMSNASAVDQAAAEVALQAAQDQVDAAKAQVDAARDSVQAAESIRDATEQLRDSMQEAVSSQFTGSLTGGGLDGLYETLQSDVNGGSSMEESLNALIAAGLDTTGPASGLLAELSASEDQQTINEILAAAASDPEYITQLEQMYAQRQEINDRRGDTIADALYGEQLAADNAAVAVANAALAQATAAETAAVARAAALEGRLNQVSEQLDAQRDATDRMADGLVDALNSVVKGGRR